MYKVEEKGSILPRALRKSLLLMFSVAAVAIGTAVGAAAATRFAAAKKTAQFIQTCQTDQTVDYAGAHCRYAAKNLSNHIVLEKAH